MSGVKSIKTSTSQLADVHFPYEHRLLALTQSLVSVHSAIQVGTALEAQSP